MLEHVKWQLEKAGVAILISEKRLQAKEVTRDKIGECIMIKVIIHQEDTIVINAYTPNIGQPKYIKQL